MLQYMLHIYIKSLRLSSGSDLQGLDRTWFFTEKTEKNQKTQKNTEKKNKKQKTYKHYVFLFSAAH